MRGGVCNARGVHGVCVCVCGGGVGGGGGGRLREASERLDEVELQVVKIRPIEFVQLAERVCEDLYGGHVGGEQHLLPEETPWTDKRRGG